jgi:ATP-dependent DNA helicase RecG
MELRLTSPIGDLTGVGPKVARLLGRLQIVTVADLLRHLPLRYERELSESNIEQLTLDHICSARGTLMATRWVGPPGGRNAKGRFEATLQDHTGTVKLTWFNAAYLRDKLHPGQMLRVQGKVGAFGGYPQMVNPRWELIHEGDEPDARPDRLRPVYPATEDLPSTRIEPLIQTAYEAVKDQLTDPLPDSLRQSRLMPTLTDAYRWVHRPEDADQAAAGRRRLAFNELLLLQLGIAIKRHFNRTVLRAPALRWSPAMDRHIRERFGFELTAGQSEVVQQIVADLQKTEPMNRLLQGDVGSGKTVVALYALLMAVADRRQGALMAPTELLAEQHYLSITRMLEGSNVRIALLSGGSGSASSPVRKALQQQIEAGEVDIVIGTQALLTESARFKDLAVVVVDEQHRFGVLQRAAFRGGVKPNEQGTRPSPHYLVMTATPIPRTLSLTIFGDLDVSIIRGLPPGRTPIVTRVVDPGKADEVYRYVVQRVREQGDQAYIVLPAIDETGGNGASQAAPLKSVQAHVKMLTSKFGPELHVAAVHGRLKSDTREAVMTRFRAGKVQVLVATTVIEVGVDVPNATLMVVEHAERFGLAQLHQLRGRVGRGSHGRKSVCVFVAEPVTPDAQQRMDAIAGTTDGFKIAEADLEIRGMGDFFGTRQHGMPPLRVARIPEDLELLQLARRDAEAMVQRDPHLHQPEHRLLRRVLLQHHGESLGLIDVG